MKKVFLEISQNSRENTCARVFFYTFLNTFFYRTPLVAASEKTPLVMDYIRVDIILVAIYCYLEREIYKVSKYHLENSFYFEISSSLV